MHRAVEVAEFLRLRKEPDWKVIDVRAPGEFGEGHLPNAVNVPLFDDEERKEVGTLYKQQGRQPAFLRGLEFVGPKLADFVRTAEAISPSRKLLVHCWRGGMRSSSLATLWAQSGFEVKTLEGGYKAYRKYIREASARPLNIIILGGMTGSGKTRILKSLAKKGEQIIDLEGLANHKGSSFGTIGELPQGTTEQFENDLFEKLKVIDPEKTVWIEDESRMIGKIFVPDALWDQMIKSPVIKLEVPKQFRVENLVNDYAGGDPQLAEEALLRIAKRMDGKMVKIAIEALHQGDYATTADLALAYYDRTYTHSINKKPHHLIFPLPLDHHDADTTADQLLDMRSQLPSFL
ncbi:MAG: tRNA 2-selenouridine(34) synthase MnmH [Bacteroidia bacterium]|nr:tRNA 2-selenouridine(34) synthase MnmH [Bacteroidia bacterium]